MSKDDLSTVKTMMDKAEKKKYIMDYNACLLAVLRKDPTEPCVVYHVDFKSKKLINKKELLVLNAEVKL